MPKILIAEDEERMRRLLGMLLGNKGHELVLCADGDEALAKFEESAADVVVTDLRLPGKGGLEVIARVKERAPETPIIVITAYGSIDSAVEAMQAGATDYITKPFEEARIHLAIERALERRQLIAENRVLRSELRARYAFDAMVVEDPRMHEVVALARQAAPSGSTVMVYGESGTGKELVTRAIHEASSRARGPFVALNCAAIPENLLESELFGHERGAFTGAVEAKRGKFELANGGTLFMDEIGELALPLQSKVLRALESQEFERVGGLKTVQTDIRFLAATNRNLVEQVKVGKFREDLFYRLNVFPIVIPPLRERTADIIPLTEHFLKRFSREMGKKTPKISHAAQELLLAHRWDGNVRELQNTVERAVILLDGDEILPRHLSIDTLDRLKRLGVKTSIETHGPSLGPSAPVEAAGAVPASGPLWRPFRIPEVGFAMEEHERELIDQAMQRSKGNKSAAAKLLGLSRATMRYRLEKFGIGDPAEEGGSPDPEAATPPPPPLEAPPAKKAASAPKKTASKSAAKPAAKASKAKARKK